MTKLKRILWKKIKMRPFNFRDKYLNFLQKQEKNDILTKNIIAIII